MSRHYNPQSAKDAASHPFGRSWRAVVQQSKLTIAWLLAGFKVMVDMFLQLGARPKIATTLEIPDAQPDVPTVRELRRELGSIRPQTLDADLFPKAVDRYRSDLEDQLSVVRHRSTS